MDYFVFSRIKTILDIKFSLKTKKVALKVELIVIFCDTRMMEVQKSLKIKQSFCFEFKNSRQLDVTPWLRPSE